MKKIITIAVSLYSLSLIAQVGVNTTTPKATLDVTARTTNGSRPEGFIAPRLTGDQIKAADAQYETAQTGTIAYATSAATMPRTTKTAGITAPGYYYFDGAVWKSLSMGGTTASVVSDCNINGFTGSYINGTAITASNKFSVTITNNSFSTANIAFQASDLVLSGVSGITVTSVTPPTASLTSGQSQLVEYMLSGTPSSSGTLMGTWAKLSLNCSKTVTVIQPPITSLDCAGATQNGILTGGIAANNVSAVINYGGGDGSAYDGQTISSTGVTGLTATLVAGNFAIGSGSLTYTITGTPSGGGTAAFPISIGGKSCTLNITVHNTPAITCGNTIQSPAGTLINNTAYTGSYTMSYTGATVGASYPAQTFTVNGLTLQRSAGTFTSASGTITYTLSGTYTGASNQIVTFNPSLIAGSTCNVVYGDAIRGALAAAGCASCTTYDAASVNDWIPVTANEYAAVYNTANIAGATIVGQANAQMNTSSVIDPTGGYTYVSNDNDAPVPANSYVIGFSAIIASSQNNGGNNVKVSASQTSGFVNMGNAFNITGSGRVYFVCKRPNTTTPNTSGNGYFGAYYSVTGYSKVVGSNSNTYYFNYPSGGNVSSVGFRQGQWGGGPYGVRLHQGITTTIKSW
ncbi:hypothetical protein SAMN05421856_106205 [Chryseobacterium taichungense]|uniref:Uncharacterized protein n=1 Tax=Chryseobacterium taichungense TaxID=295069 RepID=A0A1H8B221_9FLAO|nr:hypothetical protein [Chryseobacterium taichungense]SEM76980.1 hypothetical protein SAMN05421856_106205 [Chryseobacterium taichungense]